MNLRPPVCCLLHCIHWSLRRAPLSSAPFACHEWRPPVLLSAFLVGCGTLLPAKFSMSREEMFDLIAIHDPCNLHTTFC